MFDLKTLNLTLEQIEEEKRIPKEKILSALEDALAVAYKKDYGKKGQIIRSNFNTETGDLDFYQVKIVIDDSIVKPALTEEEIEEKIIEKDDDERIRFNPEHHIYIDDAKIIKNDVILEEELIFPLQNPLDENKEFGRVAAQTARQVIIQKIREAERESIMEEYSDMEGEIISGRVQKIERGMIYVDLDRATGIIPKEEQIPGEFFKTGDRIKVYLYKVEEDKKNIQLKLSRSHPGFVVALFEMESPEVANGDVEIKAIAREAGSRNKVAVLSNNEDIDPIGACVGQRGIRILTIMNEINGEKIDIIPWSENEAEFVANSLAPAKVLDIEINEEKREAIVEVAGDQLSLAIGKGGQNVRLAAKLTNWKIDIKGINEENIEEIKPETTEEKEEEEEEKKDIVNIGLKEVIDKNIPKTKKE